MSLRYRIKQYMKMFLQNVYLPRIYQKECVNLIQTGKILFADAHCNGITPSMQAVYERLKEYGYEPEDMCVDFADMSVKEKISYLKRFMKEYATAEYVFLSDYFMPVSACRKRAATKVIQLWHSGGLMKKMGYDAPQDIPPYYKGQLTKNYDIVTVSAEQCVPVWAQAFRIPEECVKPLGLARTDIYYDEDYNRKNREDFYRLYPEAEGKKIAVYAPTFSGRASQPKCAGLNAGIEDAFRRLQDEWFFIIKLHPYLERKYPKYHSEMKTEALFEAADLLITDYSSVLFDYLIYEKPFLLFAPDLDCYELERGLYVDYYSFPAPVVTSAGRLEALLRTSEWQTNWEALSECRKKYMGCCDGHSVERILAEAGLKRKRG